MDKPKDKKIPDRKAITKNTGRRHPRITTKVTGPSKTKQSFASETDINVIMAKYKNTGQMPVLNNRSPSYGYAPAIDFREALELVDKISENFDKLPSEIRQRFDYNPEEFLAYVEDPVNAEELREMGLFPPIHTPTPPNMGSAPQKPQEEPDKEPAATTPPQSESDS